MDKRPKGTPQKIRPFAEDLDTARRISELTGLPLVEVLTQAMSAGLRAIKDNGYRLTLPLKAKIVESPIEPESRSNYPPHRPEGMHAEDTDPPKKKGPK